MRFWNRWSVACGQGTLSARLHGTQSKIGSHLVSRESPLNQGVEDTIVRDSSLLLSQEHHLQTRNSCIYYKSFLSTH
jgi:hypothetical protein